MPKQWRSQGRDRGVVDRARRHCAKVLLANHCLWFYAKNTLTFDRSLSSVFLISSFTLDDISARRSEFISRNRETSPDLSSNFLLKKT